jgi:hypothetical protein
MHALLAALLLAASPFPPPRLAPVTDRLKYDPGVVVSVDATTWELRISTAAGLVSFKAGADVQVFDASGQPTGSPRRLVTGQKVRIWYVVEDGARAVEIAVE